MNTVKTIHNLNIEGHSFQIAGYHEYKFKQNSIMSFDLRLLNDSGYSARKNIRSCDIRKIAAELIANSKESEKRKVYNSRFSGMSLTEVMSHSDFRYGRIIVSSTFGNYVNIYCTDKYSPTGVILAMGCSEAEFDTVAAATNNSHNYVVGNEGRRVVVA